MLPTRERTHSLEQVGSLLLLSLYHTYIFKYVSCVHNIAAVLGGVARMTIAGCVIVLEACGNLTYLLPLMLTFAVARYVGNAINEPMYDMQIHLKEMPFLEGSLHSLGTQNFYFA